MDAVRKKRMKVKKVRMKVRMTMRMKVRLMGHNELSLMQNVQ